jgi:integrase/recombinase XerD
VRCYTKGAYVLSEQLSFLPPQEPRDEPPSAVLSARSSLRRAVEAFHDSMLFQERSPNTIRSFDSDLRLLLDYLGPRTVVGHIRHAQLDAFVRYLRLERGVPCGAKSLARRITTLKVFFGWLVATDVVSSDPAAALAHPHITTPLPQVLSGYEVERLLAATDKARSDPTRPDARALLLVTLILSTGIKQSECMNLAPFDIDPSDVGSPTVFIHYASVRQRFKERRLRLPAEFSAILEEYRAQYQPATTLFGCTARNLEYVLDQAARHAGLPTRRVSFEVLRYTCALRDLRSGMATDDLRRKLGLSPITWVETLDKLERLATPAL